MSRTRTTKLPVATPPRSTVPTEEKQHRNPTAAEQDAKDPSRLGVAKEDRPFPETLAATAVSPVTTNALVALSNTRPRFMVEGGTLGINAIVQVVGEIADKAAKGDLGHFERMLAAQSVALNASFADLAMRAGNNFEAGNLDAGETYLRLAMRAQAQCRASIETLSEMKNPRPVFINAKQVNQSNGGPQQVNNAGKPRKRVSKKKPLSSNKLLEGKLHV